MDFSENFIAVVRPHQLREGDHGITVNKARVVPGSPRTTQQPYEVGATFGGAKVTVNSEADMWLEAHRLRPDIINILASKHHLVDRALAARGDLFLRHGAGALDAMEDKVASIVTLLHGTVIDALAATRLTRAKVIPRRSRQSQNVSFLYVESKLSLPYDVAPHFMVLETIPCALDPSAWGLRVRLGTTTNEVTAENYKRLDKARQLLADKGVFIRDVVSGSHYADSV